MAQTQKEASTVEEATARKFLLHVGMYYSIFWILYSPTEKINKKTPLIHQVKGVERDRIVTVTRKSNGLN